MEHIIDPAPLVEVGKKLAQAHQIKGFKPALSLPKEHQVVPLTPEKLARPRFLTAAPAFREVTAFIAYLNAFKNPHSRVFYTLEGAFFAVIDYHESGNDLGTTPITPGVHLPRHGDHVASLELMKSPEWTAWIGKSGEKMGQVEFAEFLEDHAADVLEPGLETMLAVATGLQGTTGGTFKQAFNQANGSVSLQWDEEVKGTVKGTNIEIPTSFKIAVRPFMGCSRYPVDCRFRWRAQAGGIALFFKALNVEPILEAATEAIVQRIAEETGITPWLGRSQSEVMKKGE